MRYLTASPGIGAHPTRREPCHYAGELLPVGVRSRADRLTGVCDTGDKSERAQSPQVRHLQRRAVVRVGRSR